MVRESITTRILTLLQSFLPTAFYDSGSEDIDAYDVSRGLKFGHEGQTEPCVADQVHEEPNKLACWIDPGGNVWCRCCSETCQGKFKRLGEVLPEQRNEYLAQAVFMNSQFITDNSGKPVEPLDSLVDAWVQGDFKALCLKSVTGSGKTSLIKHLMDLPYFKDKTVLYLTHRQTLAFNVTGRLGNSFHNYLDLNLNTNALADRIKYPKVVVQLDSIHKLTHDLAAVPKIHTVILDESERLFEHLSASTLNEPVFTQQKLQHTIQLATKVLALDALFAAESYEMLDTYGLDMKVLINTYRQPDPRRYHFTSDWSFVLDDILEKLKKKKTVHVASMSNEALYRLKEAVDDTFPDQTQRVMLHTSQTDDDIKRLLADADELWKDQTLVAASPTIEAGVDCSIKRFDHQYVFANLMSTTASGLFQMVWRARNIGDSRNSMLRSARYPLGTCEQAKSHGHAMSSRPQVSETQGYS